MLKKEIPYGVQKNFSVFEDTMVEMTWQEIQEAADKGTIVFLPIGIVESHGPHMDLAADFYLSTLLCRFIKQELEKKDIESLITPPFYWGVSQDVSSYAGTFSVRPETMKSLLVDIFASLKSWGFRRIFVQNAHGDSVHIKMIKEAIAEANENETFDFKVYFMWELNVEVEDKVIFPPMREERYNPDYHAGAIETAQMAAFFPDKVRTDIAKTLKPQDSFHPLAYCGYPANFDLEINVEELAFADTMHDVLEIEAALKRDGR